MKKQFLFSVLLILSSASLFADYGKCVIYEAKYYLKDGTSFKGLIEVKGEGKSSYLTNEGTNAYTSDQGMWELLKEITSSNNYEYVDDGGLKTIEDYGKITFYKSMQELPLLATYKSRKNWPISTFGFVLKSNIVFKKISEIEQIIFWDAHYSKRDWLTTEMIIANPNMVNTVKNKRFWNRYTVSRIDSNFYLNDDYSAGIQMINYNSKVNTKELKRLANLKFSSLYLSKSQFEFIIEYYDLERKNLDEKLWSRKVYEHKERYWQKLREWFWNKKILIISVLDTC